jgi:hypothetical protein
VFVNWVSFLRCIVFDLAHFDLLESAKHNRSYNRVGVVAGDVSVKFMISANYQLLIL